MVETERNPLQLLSIPGQKMSLKCFEMTSLKRFEMTIGCTPNVCILPGSHPLFGARAGNALLQATAMPSALDKPDKSVQLSLFSLSIPPQNTHNQNGDCQVNL